MSSSSVIMNVKTIYTNNNNKIFKNNSKKNIRNSYNINNNFISINNHKKGLCRNNEYVNNNNCIQSFYKRSFIKSSFENDKSNQTLSSRKSIVSTRNNKRKLPFKI